MSKRDDKSKLARTPRPDAKYEHYVYVLNLKAYVMHMPVAHSAKPCMHIYIRVVRAQLAFLYWKDV